MLETLNGQCVRSLAELYRAYEAFSGEFLEFSFSHGGNPIILDAQQCRSSANEILRMHAIPSSVSKAILEEATEAAA